MLHFAWIAPLVLLIVYLASPRHRGEIAETRVRRILKAGLEKNRYTVLDDVVVPHGGGTISIDHVVVSKFGIFVIESQYARGWVSGTEVQDRWKQYHLKRFTRFDNPMHRNRLQAEALGALLDAPQRVFHRIVVMAGQKGFKKSMPANVLEPEKLIRYIRGRGEQRLDDEQAARALRDIEHGRLGTGGGAFFNGGRLLRWALSLALLAGLYLAFGEAVERAVTGLQEGADKRAAPALYHPDGSKKTEHELWEDSLRCAWSSDTGRCACYKPNGQRAELSPEACRELAERGSILKK